MVNLCALCGKNLPNLILKLVYLLYNVTIVLKNKNKTTILYNQFIFHLFH